MDSSREVRADKFLWAVRIFKTRSAAAEACRKGRVEIENQAIKPSRVIKAGDLLTIRKMPVRYSYRVKDITERRVSARLAENFIEDLTPEEELEKLLVSGMISGYSTRQRGRGRPTKRERRDLDSLHRDLFDDQE